jgi:hypothetical protein
MFTDRVISAQRPLGQSRRLQTQLLQPQRGVGVGNKWPRDPHLWVKILRKLGVNHVNL